MADPKRLRRDLLRFALSLPGAYEDHPWDEDVARVGRKVFAFFGQPDNPDGPGMTIKLGESHEAALAIPGAGPSGYGLGRSNWVSFRFGDRTPPYAVLKDWVEESYRIIAPKSLVAELDASG
jgi:predicted DNA-binding protein (MmcQ/YjbR family)